MTDPIVVNQPEPTVVSADALVAAGAVPVTADPDAMMAQILELQRRLDAMAAAQGIPLDPIEGTVKAVKDHVQARMDANPSHDWVDVPDALKKLSDKPTKDETEYLRACLDEVGNVEGLEYIVQLAKSLHKLVLKG